MDGWIDGWMDEWVVDGWETGQKMIKGRETDGRMNV